MLSIFRPKRDIGIDLGTANTLMYVSGKGITLKEPSVVAIDANTRTCIAAGSEAKEMLGKTPEAIKVIRPLKDGVIADFDAADQMIKIFIQRSSSGRSKAKNVVIGVPSGVTGVERRAVKEAGLNGADKVFLIDEPVAAAIGAGLPVTQATGSMIVDIGGGTTEIAVMSLGGSVIKDSLRVAGDELTEAICGYLKKVHNLVVGEKTSEDLKIALGSAYASEENDSKTYEVRGIQLMTGLPKTIIIKGGEVREAITDPLLNISQAIKNTLERTPPELVSDIVDRGIMLAGGGALIRGISDYISRETGVLVHIAEDPLLAVVNGTGIIVDQFSKYFPKLQLDN